VAVDFRSVIEHLRFVIAKPKVFFRITYYAARKVFFNKDALRTVDWALTYDCNSKCIMCSCAGMRNPKRKNLTLEQIGKVWPQCLSLGASHVNLTGGEPLLRNIDELSQIIRIFNQGRKALVSLVTNSLILTREKLEKLKRAGLDFIVLSIESTDAGINDGIRGMPGHHKKVMDAISWAKDLGLIICLSSVVTRDNIDKLGPMIDYTNKIGSFFLLCQVSASGKWQDRKDKKILHEHIDKFNKLLEIPHLRSDFILNFNGRMGCPGGKERIYITAFGDVMMCPQVQISFGNVLKEPLAEIWQKMRSFPAVKKHFSTCKQAFDPEFIKNYIEPLKGHYPLPLEINDQIFDSKREN